MIKKTMEVMSMPQSDIMEFILYGDADGHTPLIKRIEDNCRFSFGRGVPNTIELYGMVIDSAIDYMSDVRGPASYRKRYYAPLYRWCGAFAEALGVPESENRLGELRNPMTIDTAVDLVKALHDREGKTKADLQSDLGLKAEKKGRSILNNLNRLTGKQEPPLRLAGQEICVRVVEQTVRNPDNDGRRKLFYTPNTMHPIVFQLNLMQVATLLQALQYSCFIEDNALPLDLAVDVWCQLSEYAKERIQEVFCPHDPNFEDFLAVVSDAIEGHSHRFMEESAMLDRTDLNPKERLYLVEKQVGPYDIELCNPPRTRKYQNSRFTI